MNDVGTKPPTENRLDRLKHVATNLLRLVNELDAEHKTPLSQPWNTDRLHELSMHVRDGIDEYRAVLFMLRTDLQAKIASPAGRRRRAARRSKQKKP